MNNSNNPNDESLPFDDLVRIDKVCTQFEESRKAGTPERIEDLLEGFEGRVRDWLLLQLLLLDFEYRSQPGAQVPYDEYRDRFPDDQDVVEEAIQKAAHDRTMKSPGQMVDPNLISQPVQYVGDYEIREEIAPGGMGIVFKARQSTLGRIVAIKMMLSGQLSTEDQIVRFNREAKLAAKLQHPNILAVHEVGQHEGMPYFSMDYVESQSLSLSVLVRDNPLPPKTQPVTCRSPPKPCIRHTHGKAYCIGTSNLPTFSSIRKTACGLPTSVYGCNRTIITATSNERNRNEGNIESNNPTLHIP